MINFKGLLTVLWALTLIILATQELVAKQNEIVIAMWTGPEYDNLVKTAKAYEELTGVRVIIEEIARDAYEAKLTTTLLAGTSDYDVVYLNASSLPKVIEAGGLEPMETFGDNPNYADLKPAVDALVYKGTLYGYPTEADCVYMYYRTDILEKAGVKPPDTWPEYLKLAQELNNPPELYGTIVAAKLPSYVFYDFSSWLLGAGGGWMNKDYNPLWSSPENIKAIDRYVKAVQEGYAPPDAAATGYPELNSWFQQGRVAMMIQWVAARAELMDCNLSPAICDKVGIKIVPRYGEDESARAILGSLYSWSIPRASKNKDAAYDFVFWLTSPKGAKLWALYGGIPANQQALNDPDVLKIRPDFELLAKSLKYVSTPPVTTVTSELVENAAIELNSAVVGAKSSEEAAQAIQEKWERILSEAGYR